VAARHGLFLPPFDDLADPRLLARLAASAEGSGWDGFFLWDHIQYRPPVTRVLDPWVALAAVATATERLVLGPMVTPLARRRPWVLAREAATLDLLSQGRLVLGVGLGLDTSGAELSTFGEETDARERAAIYDEALGLVVRLLSGELVQHEGAHFAVRGARFLPTPVQRPLPVWVAARWPNRGPLRRAVHHEGIFAIDLAAPDDLLELRALLGELVAELPDDARRDGPFEVVTMLRPEADPDPWEEAGATWLLWGPSAFDIELGQVRALAEEGPPRR